jgi:hypothetical protein
MADQPQLPPISHLNRTVPMDSSTSRRMAFTLIALLLPVVVAGFIVQASVDPPPSESVTATLSQVKDGHLVEIRDARGAVVLSGEFRSRVDSLGNTEKDAELTDQQGRTVIGEVELEIPGPGREHRRPELEVDVIHLQPRQHYTVVIDDRTVGSFTTDDRGSADMELQEGETLTDPAM